MVRPFIAALITAVLACVSLSAQEPAAPRRFIAIAGGMSVGAQYSTTIADFINSFGASSDQQEKDIVAIARFSINPEMQIADEVSLGLEYSYTARSADVTQLGYGIRTQFGFDMHTPMVTAHYLIPGPGYWFKIGGGLGYEFCRLEMKYSSTDLADISTASGPACKLDVTGLTALDKHWYAVIGAELGTSWMGDFYTADGAVVRTGVSTATFNPANVLVKLGIAYVF